jgi:hypothetical protein
MRELRLIICGDRFWQNRDIIYFTMRTLKDNLGNYTVIEGEAPGADSMARAVAKINLNLPYAPYPAKWETYGKAASPMRNTQMRIDGRADAVVAFHYDLKRSRGTKNMVEQAMRAGLPVWIVSEGPAKLAEFIIRLKEIQREEE